MIPLPTLYRLQYITVTLGSTAIIYVELVYISFGSVGDFPFLGARACYAVCTLCIEGGL